MCGIAFLITRGDGYDDIWNDLSSSVNNRGPDFQHTVIETCNGYRISLHASVLHMRGSILTKQPFCSSSSYMIYNGEVFDGLDISSDENDGAKLFEAIENDNVANVLDNLDGPCAIVHFDRNTQKIAFARDALGRRSLLVHFPSEEEPYFALCSVMPVNSSQFVEVDTDRMHYIQLLKNQDNESIGPALCSSDLGYTSGVRLRYHCANINNDLLPNSSLDYKDELNEAVSSLHRVLQQSILVRSKDIPSLTDSSSKVGVLFSGGIDCTVLALLLDSVLDGNEPIDLLNVAFENPRTLANKKDKGDVYSVPDRITGRDSFNELQKLCPNRKWRFIEIDIDYETCCKAKETVIQLMKPSDTVMDLSIALALYFAARGKGKRRRQEQCVDDASSSNLGILEDYTSDARVLFSGLGADEQLGGYSRHRKAYEMNGWYELQKELKFDLERIGTRNLGRDDRVISSHGKEARYPFLGKYVIETIAAMPVYLRCDPRLGEGVGDKRVLRELAVKLGLQGAAANKKRAIQFGARSAKMELESGKRQGDQKLN